MAGMHVNQADWLSIPPKKLPLIYRNRFPINISLVIRLKP